MQSSLEKPAGKESRGINTGPRVQPTAALQPHVGLELLPPSHFLLTDVDTSNLAQNIMIKQITIKNIELCNQVQRNIMNLVPRRYSIRLSVGGTSHSTEIGNEGKNRTLWNQSFYFDANDHSQLAIRVYQKHRTKKDELIGTLTDTIDGILGSLKNGVLEDTPLIHPSSGSVISTITIKFSMTAEQRGTVGAIERQAIDAATSANEAMSTLSPTPVLVGPLNLVVSDGPDIEAILQGSHAFQIAWNSLLKRLQDVDRIVTGLAEIHPYTSLAWSVISAANKVLVNQQARDEQISRLVGTMNDVLEFADGADALKTIQEHAKGFTRLMQQVTECGYFIVGYAKQKSFVGRAVKCAISDIDTTITTYVVSLQQIKTSFLEGVTVQTGITVIRMMDVVERSEEKFDLNDMPYAKGARFEREKGCLPGTRETFLREICDVLNNADEDAPRICLLTGVAGSGKSAVAHSIARLYDGQQRLGSSYCFLRTDTTNRNPSNLFSTIARDLCDHDPQYKRALWEVVKGDRALCTSQSPMEQVERFIIEPFQNLNLVGPLVIVIDALDESGDAHTRQHLLLAIFEHLSKDALPSNLRFLITARPEIDILRELPVCSQIVHKHINDIPGETIDRDIERFVFHSLHRYIELEPSWPDQDWCQELVRHSEKLFQWAAVACSFIRDGAAGLDLHERFKMLLQTGNREGVDGLDDLYRAILKQHFPSDGAKERFREMMAVVLALNEPLSIPSLSALLTGPLNVRGIFRPLGSLLDGALNEERPIRPLHTSFRDFLLDKARSGVAFHVKFLPQHSLSLGRASVRCMSKMLRFNICNLKDSRIRNSAVPDLASRVNKAIPPHLAYSCLYWMDHLQQTSCTPDLLTEVTTFFKEFFPYWLEAISLLSLSSPLSTITSALETCTILQKWAQGHEIATIASETFRFIQVFTPVLQDSTPHLYLSALPQTPTNSLLCPLWKEHLKKHVVVNSEQPATWPAQVHVLHGHKDSVTSVAYSPDGVHIVSGSEDNTIKVWSATTGQPVAGPFQGHTSAVSSVAYSPDGAYIVSGSEDNTIRIWNATTGQPVTGPFQGHTSTVSSVAYSPDGSHVVSGSWDKTIRVWNATNGQAIGEPFEGHTDPVNSVAYSPDGVHIFSGSSDNTLRIWDAATGQSMAGTLQGHTYWATSVAFSPDGVHIVFGSWNGVLEVWNAACGQLIAGPFQGHAKTVSSVAYSLDGVHIVSGSQDMTIRVWNATTGQPVAGPFQGHADSVITVAYSPDGVHIVSGSSDNTLMVWNATSGQTVGDSFQGDANKVNSVAYSPDGAYIVSGSDDKTLRIWNATTGQPVAGPFQGHTEQVTTVAYSPDGAYVVSGSWDETLRVWNATTGQLVAGPFHRHTHWVTSVAFSPNGVHIASASNDDTIRIWNATTGQPVAVLFHGHIDLSTFVAYSPDGVHVVSGSEDETLRVWNATTGQSVAGPFQGHTSIVTSVAYSPDGSHIVSGSWDKTIRVWNAATGQPVAGPFQGHTNTISSVAYSPDGVHIVSSSQDHTIRVWNAISGQPVAGPFKGHNHWVTSVVFSPDGTHILSCSPDLSIKVWKTQDLFFFGDLDVESNWIQSSNGHCFGWIAPWHKHLFLLPIHSLVIYAYDAHTGVNVDKSLFGESWISCWQ